MSLAFALAVSLWFTGMENGPACTRFNLSTTGNLLLPIEIVSGREIQRLLCLKVVQKEPDLVRLEQL